MKKFLSMIIALSMVCSLSAPAFSDTDLPPDAIYNSGGNLPAHFTGTATPTTTLTVNDGGNISATAGVSIDTINDGSGIVNFQGTSTVAGTVGSSGLNIGTVNVNGINGTVDLQSDAYVTNVNIAASGTAQIDGTAVDAQ